MHVNNSYTYTYTYTYENKIIQPKKLMNNSIHKNAGMCCTDRNGPGMVQSIKQAREVEILKMYYESRNANSTIKREKIAMRKYLL